MTKSLSKGLARRSDPATSHEAAEAIVESLTRLEQIVANIIKKGSQPDGVILDEVVSFSRIEKVSISPRFSSLERKGIIYTKGQRPGRSGRNQRKWFYGQPTA